MRFHFPDIFADARLMDVSRYALADEVESVEKLLPLLDPLMAQRDAVQAKARHHIETLRSKRGSFTVETFLQEYGLDSREGISLMALAEALLRIPDEATAHALVGDKFAVGDWRRHVGKSESLLVNLSSLGLAIADRLTQLRAPQPRTLADKLRNAVAGGSEPMVLLALKQAIAWLGGEFVLGATIEKALAGGAECRKKGYCLSYDMLGEGARSQGQSAQYLKNYEAAATAIGAQASREWPLYQRDSLSVKLSALHPRYEFMHWAEVKEELLPRVKALLRLAMAQGIAVTIDAEEASRLEMSLMLLRELLSDSEFSGFEGIGLAVQAYQKRAIHVIEYLRDLAQSLGRLLPVRLVKGAYWDGEIKRAQMGGLTGFPVFTQKVHTDISYLACASLLLKSPACFYPQFATHNALTIAGILTLGQGKEYEFQRLYGMGEGLYDQLIEEEKIRCRIYAPVGSHRDLLSYLIRRMLENGANSSFVHAFADKTIPVESLLADPLESARKTGFEPAAHISAPEALFVNRKNSAGVELGYLQEAKQLHRELDHFSSTRWQAGPLVSGKTAAGEVAPLMQPADLSRQVGSVVWATPKEVEEAISAAVKGFEAWATVPVEERASALERIADLYEEYRYELVALCMREAGKTLSDSIAEIREAIDFCRYYAAEARRVLAVQHLPHAVGESNRLSLHGRGVFACISPWNFPLAIFTGQVVAALVSGNAVIAKPAPQTPLIAQFAVSLMQRAGIPLEALHLLPGGGEIGEALVKDPRIAGVVFTGSTATAQRINAQLAARSGPIVPLIAETGGQNCMIVDSSALIEQAVDDVLLSAFGSAGQRCSALRVLFVQEEIAEPLIALVAGAMGSLRLGNPMYAHTDIGPVIDAAAKAKLEAHIARMKREAKLIAAAPLPEHLPNGHYVPPHAFEILSLEMLQGEVFGPVLHVVRYKASELDKVLGAINATGYGLTLGIHSRIDGVVEHISRRARVGNIYVNRGMTGAVVGMQPFGGEGLSGTGPKAGGPHYLPRFCTERTVTVNTAAAFGSLELFTVT